MELLVPAAGQEFPPAVAQVLENKSNICPPAVTSNPEHGLGRNLDPDHFRRVCLATQRLYGGSSSGLE